MENELTDFLRRIPWANRTLLENFFGVGSFDKMLAQNSPCIWMRIILTLTVTAFTCRNGERPGMSIRNCAGSSEQRSCLVPVH